MTVKDIRARDQERVRDLQDKGRNHLGERLAST